MLVLVVLVHSFYSQQCCAEKDCHPVPCSEVRQEGDGWNWHNKFFPKATFRNSEDDGCHVCTGFMWGREGHPICIYLPSRA